MPALRLDLSGLRLRESVFGAPGRALAGRARPLIDRTWRVVRTFLGPLTSTVSGLGWGSLGAGLLAGAVGWSQGWTELRVAALFLGLVLGSALLWTIGRMAFEASIELPKNRVTVGEQALGRILVRNTGGRSLSGSRFELPVGAGLAAFDVPAMAASGEHEQLIAIPAKRRSIVTIGPVRSVKADPLQLVHRVKHWSEAVELYVHPKTVLLDATSTGFLRDIEGVTTHNLSSSDVAFHALRDYVPGDDRRNIHWRTTARLGKLMVRQFEETQRSHLLIVLSLRTADYQNADEFETAVSSVASMAAQALRESREVSVFTHAGVLRFPSAVGLFDRLSGVDQVSTPTTFAELALAAITDVPHASVVALVTGGATSPQDLRAAHVRIPLQVKTFAVRCAADSVCARRRIANLVVLDVPAVEDLARSIRTVR